MLLLSLLSLILVLIGQTVGDGVAWTNPLVPQRADPHVTWHNGQYLFTATVPEYDRIELRRAKTLDGLRGPVRDLAAACQRAHELAHRSTKDLPSSSGTAACS